MDKSLSLSPSARNCEARTSHIKSRETGFSLLEVLISIVILSFGVLGMVGLQATALQSNRDARLQSAAASYARELAEMMRGDRVASQLTTNNPYINDFTAPLTPTTASYCMNVGGTGCTDTTAVANAQMTEWLARVAADLPGAHVVVCTDAAPIGSDNFPKWACTAGSNATTFIKIGWTRGSTNRASTTLDSATRPSIVFPVAAGSS